MVSIKDKLNARAKSCTMTELCHTYFIGVMWALCHVHHLGMSSSHLLAFALDDVMVVFAIGNGAVNNVSNSKCNQALCPLTLVTWLMMLT